MYILKDGMRVGTTKEVEAFGKGPRLYCAFWTKARLKEGDVYELRYDDGWIEKIRIANAPVPDSNRKSTRVSASFVSKRRRKL
jgi:hypothetical protein